MEDGIDKDTNQDTGEDTDQDTGEDILKKYYSFAIVLSSSDKPTPGIQPEHYVTYIRRLKGTQEKMELEFYFESSELATEFKTWVDKLKKPEGGQGNIDEELEQEFIDPDECRGYASERYLKDLRARVSKLKEGEYLKVGRIQYPDLTAEILLGAGSTQVIFASYSKEKIDSLNHHARMWIVPLNKYGIKLDDRTEVIRVTDEKLLRALLGDNTLRVLDARDMGRVY